MKEDESAEGGQVLTGGIPYSFPIPKFFNFSLDKPPVRGIVFFPYNKVAAMYGNKER
jgi:hypothetical protein